jgi:hypothetical protein
MTAAILTAVLALFGTPADHRHPPPPPPPEAPATAKGTWSPDGIVCRPGATPVCRYVAPGCELVRIMDDRGPGLSGTRYEVWCRPPWDVD